MAESNKVTLDSIWDYQEGEETVEGLLPNGAEVKLTISVYSAYMDAFHLALINQTFNYVQEKYGMGPVEVMQAEDNPNFASLVHKFGSMWERCWMLPAVTKVEVRANADAEWVEDQLPAKWRNIETFTNAIPKKLYRDWREVVMRLNPELFTKPQTDDAKKNEPPTETDLINESS